MGGIFSNILSLTKSKSCSKEENREKILEQQEEKKDKEDYLTINNSDDYEISESEEEFKKESKINITLSREQVSAVVGEVIKDFKKTYSLKEGNLDNYYFKLNQGDDLAFSDLIKSCKKSERVCKQSIR